MLTSIMALIGKNLIFFEEIESTNLHAAELLSKTNPINGTCIMTDFQTAGRGQIGRSWHSERSQNLLLSYIYLPREIDVQGQFYINMAVALAIKSALYEYCDGVSIKWPNDIYIHDEKVCGILIQNSIQGSAIKSSIIGLGINVNQTSFPSELANPTSIASQTGIDIDRMEVLQKVSKSLGEFLQLCENGKYSQVHELYNAHLYRKDQRMTFASKDGDVIDGIIKSVDIQGRLMLENASGQAQAYTFGELKMRI